MYFHLELKGTAAAELPLILGKHPDRIFEWECLGSMVRVFFPVHEPQRVRAVVLFWPDVRGISRRNGKAHTAPLELVEPRAYSVNSLFCQALRTAFTVIQPSGRPPTGPAFERVQPFELLLSPLCTYLPPDRIEGLFEPLGFKVKLTPSPSPEVELSVRHPRVFELHLEGSARIPDLLRQLMVMIMVMDSERHEYMNQADLDRLTRLGQGWLDPHPEKNFIVSRYLIYRRLVDAFSQNSLESTRSTPTSSPFDDGYDAGGEPMPLRVPPDGQRVQQLVQALTSLPSAPRRLLQIGCGDARLLTELVGSSAFDEVVVMDPSAGAIERARKRLDRSVRFGQALRRQPTRFEAIVSALGYSDSRLSGFDAVLLHDPVERFEGSRLQLYLAPVFESWRPGMVVLTASNRSASHEERGGRAPRTELDRLEFESLCATLSVSRGYQVEVRGVGSEQPDRVPSLLIAIFTRLGGA